MAENAGAIVYTVDMDTAAVTKGADRVNAALDSVGKGADRLDGTMGKAERTVTQTGKASAKAANDVGRLEKATEGASNAAGGFAARLTPLAAAIGGLVTAQAILDLGKMAEQFTLLQARIKRLSTDSETAAATYNRLLSVAAATGQTMPETVKLWETLTSSLKSLGATNDQVITLTSTLQKIGKIGGSSADETANALRQLGQSLAGGTLRAEEFNSIVEQTPELIRQLAAASGRSMGEFRQAMLDGKITSQELFDLLMKRTQDVDAEFKKLPRSVADAANAIMVQMGAAASAIDQATSASKALAFILDRIADGIQVTFNPTDVQRFNTLLRDRSQAESVYQAQLQNGSKRSQEAAKKRLDSLNAEIKAMQEARIAAIKAQSGGGGTSAGKPSPTTTTEGQKAIAQLAEQNQQLRAQGVERAKIIALQKLGAGATQQEKDAAVALAVENYNFTEAEKKAKKDAIAATAAKRKATTEAAAQARKEEAERKKAEGEAKRGAEQNQKAFADLGSQLAQVGKTAREVFMDQAELSLNGKFATPDQIQRIRELAAALYDARNARQALAAADPIAGAQISFEDQLKQYQALNDQKLLSDQRYTELKGQAERAHLEEMRVLQEENFRRSSLGNQILIDSLNQLQQAGTQAFVGLITGASNGQQAVQALASALLNEAVGALVQMGVQYVKNMIIGQTAQTAATTASVAAAGIVGSAWAGPAGLVSLASFGANAVPAQAAIGSTIALAKGAALAGGRQYGGPVAAGSLYRVNEGGAPEIFNAAGGKQYMMPNSRGEVVSNKDATAQGGAPAAPVVNVNNYSGAPATAAAKFSESDKQWVIDVVVGDMQAGGKTGQTANRITGTQRRGS